MKKFDNILLLFQNAHDIMMKAVHICSDNGATDTGEENSHNCQRENDMWVFKIENYGLFSIYEQLLSLVRNRAPFF